MAAPLPAFAGVGLELEYAIVERGTLEVRPIADRLLAAEAGRTTNDVERGRFGWSNELVLHLVELKNNAPEASLAALAEGFQAEVRHINGRLAALGAQLMPGAMHPWMDPARETRLWPHDYAEIYRTYDRVFDCRRHGWANLQSMHVNLPFANDAEFARLLAAVRCVLPIVPALAASSPIEAGAPTGTLDNRMRHYLGHAARIASMMGAVIPELVDSEADYRAQILAPMYREIAPLDDDGVMQDEWLNARGAIARFDRHAIELRVIDTQECPFADAAVAAATIGAVRACYDGRLGDPAAQRALDTARLRSILESCIRSADAAVLDDADYLRALGATDGPTTAGELWKQLVATCLPPAGANPGLFTPPPAAEAQPWRAALDRILADGPLARRILRATGPAPSGARLHAVYQRLCECLAEGAPFTGET